MTGLFGPILPCGLKDCTLPAVVVVELRGQQLTMTCQEHEWLLMKKLKKTIKDPIEAEKGWQMYCAERGFDPLATTWRGVLRAQATVQEVSVPPVQGHL